MTERFRAPRELPRGLPEGTVWAHRCLRCGETFEIHPVGSIVLFQVVLAAVALLLLFQGGQEVDGVTGRAEIFGGLVFALWVARLVVPRCTGCARGAGIPCFAAPLNALRRG